MKKIIAIIALSLMAISLNAKEVSRNPSTDTVLDETAGVYSLMGKTGVIILGSLKDARNFFAAAEVSFAQESISEVITIGEQKYTVGKDDTGLYIIKLGLGAVKVRPSDAALFLTVTEGTIAAQKAKKIWKVITE